MSRTIGILATLDTKSEECGYLAAMIRERGHNPFIVDIGVLGEPGLDADVARDRVAAAAGESIAALRAGATRERSGPAMVRGATRILLDLVQSGVVHALIGLGGTQGTSSCSQVMQALPYGFPKVMVSTVASGDVSPFVGIKDITMMFSVGDLLGLNAFTRRVLANAAGAACGMAEVPGAATHSQGASRTVAITNLGVLTEGAKIVKERLESQGFETIVFHAVGSGGRAMEQMMREGLVHAVFDYAMGEITDELFGGLRAAGPERLTVAGRLGLPQLICPGGVEHVGVFVDPPQSIPERWKGHAHVFHSPVIYVPRLDGDEMARVAAEARTRLSAAVGPTILALPLGGTSRYSKAGGPLRDAAADARFFEEIARGLPAAVEVFRHPGDAENPDFLAKAVDLLSQAIRSQVDRGSGEARR